MKYVASLISGVGIFCVGTGLSIYHGVTGLLHPEPIHDFYWVRRMNLCNFCNRLGLYQENVQDSIFLQAYFILAGSLVSEGATWLVAFNSIRKGAKEVNMTVKDYSKSITEFIYSISL